MKRVIGLIMVGLGVALVVCAPLFKFYVGPSAAQAPIDQTYSVSIGDGVMVKQLDIAKFATGAANPHFPPNQPMTSTRYTRADVIASEQEQATKDNIAVFDTFTRTNVSDGRLVTASSSVYPFNRKTSELANCCGANAAGEPVNFTGIMPLKFPFFTKQQTYQLWDDTLQGSAPANFVDKEDHAGLSTYKFEQVIPKTEIPNSTQTIAGTTFGTGLQTFSKYYASKMQLWVEPLTGQLLDTKVEQNQWLITKNGSQTLDAAVITATGNPKYVAGAAASILPCVVR